VSCDIGSSAAANVVDMRAAPKTTRSNTAEIFVERMSRQKGISFKKFSGKNPLYSKRHTIEFFIEKKQNNPSFLKPLGIIRKFC
jgi:hypothetical protein